MLALMVKRAKHMISTFSYSILCLEWEELLSLVLGVNQRENGKMSFTIIPWLLNIMKRKEKNINSITLQKAGDIPSVAASSNTIEDFTCIKLFPSIGRHSALHTQNRCYLRSLEISIDIMRGLGLNERRFNNLSVSSSLSWSPTDTLGKENIAGIKNNKKKRAKM